METNTLPAIPENQNTSSFHFHPLPLLIYTIIIVLTTTGAFFLGIEYASRQKPTEPTVAAIPTTIPTALPTTDATTNWKTYKNNSISFKYPSLWVISEDVILKCYGDENSKPIINIGYRDQYLRFCKTNITFNNILNNILPKHQHIDIQNMGELSVLSKNNNVKNTIFSTLSEGDGTYSILVYTTYKENNYLFSSHTGRNQVDQILSTFKFLD